MEFEGVSNLWTEITEDSDVLDILFLETEQFEDNFKLFNTNDEEFLKLTISKINKMLNEVRSTPKGLLLLSRMTSQINSSSIVNLYDALGSSLNLVMKNISIDPACQILINILPKCLKQPDLHQTISSSIIPKIYEFLLERINSNPLDHYLELLTICLTNFPGPSLAFRNKIERLLLKSLGETIYKSKSYNDIFPLLSICGGKGPDGDRHIKDWQEMLLKFSNHLYETLVQLYSDFCPLHHAHNPFAGNEDLFPGILKIVESNVLVKMSLLKRRLLNLSSTICSYLGNTFITVKLVPASGLLNLITKMLLVNPIEVLSVQNATKETVFFAGILPSIHQASISMLQSLIICTGTNLFPLASTIDQIFVQEFKWMIQKPNSFENVALDLYKTLVSWLKITNGSFSSYKITTFIMEILMKSIEIRKETLQLTLCSNVGKNRKKGQKRKASSSSTSQPKTFSHSSTKICRRALEVLALIIPTLEQKLYDVVYEKIIGIVIEYSSDTEYSNQYIDPKCRLNCYECLFAILISPNFKSGVSLSLVVKILSRGFIDKSHDVSNNCREMIFHLETLVHPISPSLSFPISSTFESRKENVRDLEIPIITDEEIQEMSINLKDSFCQTDEGDNEFHMIPINEEKLERCEKKKGMIENMIDKESLKEILTEFFDERFKKYEDDEKDWNNIKGEEILANEYGYPYFIDKLAKMQTNDNSGIEVSDNCKKRKISTNDDDEIKILEKTEKSIHSEIKITFVESPKTKIEISDPESSPEIVIVNELNFDAMIQDFVE